MHGERSIIRGLSVSVTHIAHGEERFSINVMIKGDLPCGFLRQDETRVFGDEQRQFQSRGLCTEGSNWLSLIWTRGTIDSIGNTGRYYLIPKSRHVVRRTDSWAAVVNSVAER